MNSFGFLLSYASLTRFLKAAKLWGWFPWYVWILFILSDAHSFQWSFYFTDWLISSFVKAIPFLRSCQPVFDSVTSDQRDHSSDYGCLCADLQIIESFLLGKPSICSLLSPNIIPLLSAHSSLVQTTLSSTQYYSFLPPTSYWLILINSWVAVSQSWTPFISLNKPVREFLAIRIPADFFLSLHIVSIWNKILAH